MALGAKFRNLFLILKTLVIKLRSEACEKQTIREAAAGKLLSRDTGTEILTKTKLLQELLSI